MRRGDGSKKVSKLSAQAPLPWSGAVPLDRRATLTIFDVASESGRFPASLFDPEAISVNDQEIR